MKLYEIFKSEGGYRVCGGIWVDGNPIMGCSPYFATREEAEKAALRMKKEAKKNRLWFEED